VINESNLTKFVLIDFISYYIPVFFHSYIPYFISLNINLFSSWYSWKIAELALNNNHCLTIFHTFI